MSAGTVPVPPTSDNSSGTSVPSTTRVSGMKTVFLSYHRDDTQFVTSALAEQLERRRAFGRRSVFMDIDHIPPGVEFRDVLEDAIGRCQFFLAVIGKRWAAKVSEPNNWVRLEIEAALRRSIPVTPVLVDGATLPDPTDIPFSLRPLLSRQAWTVRHGKDTAKDVVAMVAGLRAAAARFRARETPPTAGSWWRLARWLRRRESEPRPEFLTCPFCLEPVAAVPPPDRCPVPNCGAELPPHYCRHATAQPLLLVPLIGYTASGKSTHLRALVETLRRMPAVWHRYFVLSLTARTEEWERASRRDFSEGWLPPATPPGLAGQPLMFALNNLPRWQRAGTTGRTLLLHDLAGEHFMSLDAASSLGPFLSRSRVVTMQFALSDLEARDGIGRQENLFDLVGRYIQTVERGTRPIGRPAGLVVNLSKGDEYRYGVADWPESLHRYLADDPIRAALDRGQAEEMTAHGLDEYLRRMAEASDAIRDHLLTRPKQAAAARAILALAADRGIEVRFTLSSSLGQQPDQTGRLLGAVAPYRVLDPLLTALEMGA